MQSRSLGKLERKVMEIIWAQECSSVRQVLNKLGKDHKRAYTTIATVLDRLHTKGLLSRIEQGSVYFYFPKLSRELYSKSVARSFMDNFVRSFGDVAIASFAESIDKLPKSKRADFLKLLKKDVKN